MYNRYLRNDHGTYTPIPDDAQESSKASSFSKLSDSESYPEAEPTPSGRKHALNSLKELYHSLAERLHLPHRPFHADGDSRLRGNRSAQQSTCL